MAETREQPSKIATEEAPRPADEHVVTDDTDFLAGPVTSPADTETSKPAASDAAKPDDKAAKSDQKPADSADADDNSRKATTGRDRRSERRIKKLTKKLEDERTGRATDQQTIQELQTELAKGKPGPADVPEPQLKDFASPALYAKAYGKWDGDKSAAAKPAAKPGEPEKPAHVQTVSDPDITDFQDRGLKKLGSDFTEALNKKGTAVDPAMGEFMMDSDMGAEIYVHLSNNQATAKEIYLSSGQAKIEALEALEAKAEKGELGIKPAPAADGDKGGKPAKPGGRETQAKDPPSSTREAGDAQLSIDPENESMDDYATRRAKEEATKAKRGF